MNPIKLNEWSVVNIDPYTAPEVGICLVGRLDGGARVKTSIIAKVDGRLITTATGSVYELLEPDPKWLEFLKEHDIKPPTKEQPIRTIR